MILCRLEEQLPSGQFLHLPEPSDLNFTAHSCILAVLLLGKNPQTEIDAVLKQLEIGVPVNALELLRLPLTLTRGEYLALATNGILSPGQLWASSKESLAAILGNTRTEQLEKFRPKAAAEASS